LSNDLERHRNASQAHLQADRVPPCFSFELGWADAPMRRAILELMTELGRQTMNLRVMPTARLLYVRSLKEGDGIVGWGGVDADFNPKYPEVFSLFIRPDYRTYTLGLLIELARYTYLQSRGVERVYARMDRASNYSLLEYRVKNGLFQPMVPASLDPSYVSLCRRCELYGRDCAEQAYFMVDVRTFVRHGENRIGRVDVREMPKIFELRPELIRRSPRLPVLSAGGPPDGAGRTAFKPHWL
jgi:hypothetical protein